MKALFITATLITSLALSSCVFAGDQETSSEENIANAVNAEQENAQEEVDEYEGLYNVEEMNIDDDGTKIYARVYIPVEEKDTYPTVIMSHGIGGTYENCEPYAKQFAANGVVSVAFDFQGGGPASQSDGEMVDMSTLTEAQDLECVTDAVKQIDYLYPAQLFGYVQKCISLFRRRVKYICRHETLIFISL